MCKSMDSCILRQFSNVRKCHLEMGLIVERNDVTFQSQHSSGASTDNPTLSPRFGQILPKVTAMRVFSLMKIFPISTVAEREEEMEHN